MQQGINYREKVKLSANILAFFEKRPKMVGLIEANISPFPLNSRVKVNEDYGTVKYYGEVNISIHI